MILEQEKKSESGQRYRVVAEKASRYIHLKIYYGDHEAPLWQDTVKAGNLKKLADRFWRDYLSHLDLELKQKMV